MRLVFKHVDPLALHRSLVVEADTEHVKIACDQPGVVAVSHILTWQEWDELVDAVARPPFTEPAA